MTLKNQKKFAVLWLVIGIVMWVVFSTIGEESFQGGLLSGMGSAFIVVGVIRLVRVRRLEKNPEKAADYEAALKDERTIYVANKARSMTFAASVYAQLAAGLIAIFVFDQQLLGQALCFLTCFQCLLFTVLYRVYNKKY